MIRKELTVLINAGIKEKDLIVLKFTKEESETKLNWKHSREFEYNGRMYDIIEESRDGDIFVFTCYEDHKETRLNSETQTLIAKALGQDPFSKKQAERIKNLFNTFFCPDAFTWLAFQPQPSIIHYSLLTIHYLNLSPTPLSPPPKYKV